MKKFIIIYTIFRNNMEETFYLVPIKYVEMEEMIMLPNLYKEDKY